MVEVKPPPDVDQRGPVVQKDWAFPYFRLDALVLKRGPFRWLVQPMSMSDHPLVVLGIRVSEEPVFISQRAQQFLRELADGNGGRQVDGLNPAIAILHFDAIFIAITGNMQGLHFPSPEERSSEPVQRIEIYQ